MSSQGNRVPSEEASIVRGRDEFAAKNYKAALQHFTIIANKCPCNGNGGPRPRCTCKDFARVAREGGDIFNEALQTCSCGVAQNFAKCHRPNHVQALNYRSQTFDRLEHPERAKKDAEWLLEIAPKALEGYMLLGKVYRMSKEPQIAHAIWTAGLDVARKEGLGASSKFKQLVEARAPLHKHYVKLDPLTRLPPELVDKVFLDFSTRQLVTLQRVSKDWNRYIWRSAQLWANLSFLKGKPSIAWLRRLAKHHRGAVESAWFNGAVLASPSADANPSSSALGKWPPAMAATQHVKHLTLLFSRQEQCPEISKYPNMWANLSTLEISNVKGDWLARHDHKSAGAVLSRLFSLLDRNKENLERLATFMPTDSMPWCMRTLPLFPRLRVLDLVTDVSTSGMPSAFLEVLAGLTPLLEQLRIAAPSRNFGEVLEQEGTQDAKGLWQHLKAFRLHHGSGASICGATTANMDMRSLTSFEVYHGAKALVTKSSVNPLLRYCERRSDAAEEGIDISSLALPALERYWDEENPIPADLRPCLERSLDTATLAHLGFSFDGPNRRLLDSPDPLYSVQRCLEELDWLRGHPSLKSLGLFHFYINEGEAAASRRSREQIDHLVDFVDSFPNLEVLATTSNFSSDEELCYILERIVSKGRIKKVFVRRPELIGLMYRLRPLFEKHDASVSFEWDERIPPFPLELKTVGRR